jgi:hypothetical protein
MAWQFPEFVSLNPGYACFSRLHGRVRIAQQPVDFRSSIKRIEMPDDLVGALSFLTSDDAAFMTG